MFRALEDKWGRTYFSYIADHLAHEEKLDLERTVFSQRNLNVTTRATNSFSKDATSGDDVLLAFLSLLLLLVIEGIAATILLRGRNGKMSSFGFSVKYVMEMARHFDFRPLVKGYRYGNNRRRVRVWLLAIVAVALLATLGLEIAIIFLTNPKPRSVWNDQITFRMQVPVLPSWKLFYFHFRASMDKPCESLTFVGVEQGTSSVTACVSTDAVDRHSKRFEQSKTEVDVVIRSDLHQYGADHFVSVGGLSGKFSTRAVFSLNDDKPRVMARCSFVKFERNRMQILHMQLLGFLFSLHKLSEPDSEMDLERLNSLKANFSESEGSNYEVLRRKDKSFRFNSTRYTTEVRGVVPQGKIVLRAAHQLLRCAAAVFVAPVDRTDMPADLFLNEGMASKRAVVWREPARSLNWLSLFILTGGACLVLVVLRVTTSSVSIAEIGAHLLDGMGGDAIVPSLRGREARREESDGRWLDLDHGTPGGIGQDGAYSYGADGNGGDDLSSGYFDEGDSWRTLRIPRTIRNSGQAR